MEPTGADALYVELSGGFRLAMSASLVVMMFTVALGLKIADFKALKSEPRPVIIGAIAQILGLPLLTLGLIYLLGPVPSVALGMIVVACCPGGNVSNALTMFGRGDTAYSVSLTAISSVSAALITPVSILFWSALYAPTNALVGTLDISPWPFITQTVALLAFPLAMGMLMSEKKPELAARLRTALSPVALAILFGLILVGGYTNRDVLFATDHGLFPVVLMHNGLAFAMGGLTAWVFGMSMARRRSLTFEVGIQNAGLGLLILLSQFDGVGGAVAVTGLWSIWHIAAGFVVVALFRSYDWAQSKNIIGKSREV